MRPHDAFSNRCVRASGEETAADGWDRGSEAAAVERVKRTVRCRFPSVHCDCFCSWKSSTFFLLCSALKLKEEVLCCFAAAAAAAADHSSDIRQVMDIYQEALDYLHSHHVAGETRRHQIFSEMGFWSTAIQSLRWKCLLMRTESDLMCVSGGWSRAGGGRVPGGGGLRSAPSTGPRHLRPACHSGESALTSSYLRENNISSCNWKLHWGYLHVVSAVRRLSVWFPVWSLSAGFLAGSLQVL